jgi:hypothetical protein
MTSLFSNVHGHGLLALLAMTLAAQTVRGQATRATEQNGSVDCGGHAGTWLSLDQIDLVQTLDKKLAVQPASFSYSIPTGATRSYAINAALRYNLPLNERYTVGPTVEVAANTATAKKQDQIKAGVTGDFMLADPCVGRPVVPFLSAGLQGTRDHVNDVSGVIAQAQLTLQPLGRRGGLWYLSNQVFSVGELASIVLTPYAGLELQANDSASSWSRVLRGKGSYAADVKPFPHFFNERLSLTATDEFRANWIRSGTVGDHTTIWFVATADFVLFEGTSGGEPHTASVGLTYQKGANPTQSFQKQELTQFLFKIRF